MAEARSFRLDVVILGGGPAGIATALGLQQFGLATAIIEKSSYESFRVGETLPPESRRILEFLHLWDNFQQDGHLPASGTCSCWGSPKLGYDDFIANPYGYGWHLNRQRFDASLARAAQSRGVKLFSPTQLLQIEVTSEGYTLQALNCQKEYLTLQTRFVVDATGRRSVWATAQGVEKKRLDQLVGVYGLFRATADRMETFTLIEACRQGWWYSVRLPDSQIAVAFMSDSDIVHQQQLHQPEAWLSLVAQTTHTQACVIGLTLSHQKLHVYPAYSARLDRVGGQRWLAVGDAASVYDPLSGQGIYKALCSGLTAVRVINDLLQGQLEALPEYEASVVKQFDHYLLTRRNFYNLEQRWPQATFWQRRIS